MLPATLPPPSCQSCPSCRTSLPLSFRLFSTFPSFLCLFVLLCSPHSLSPLLASFPTLFVLSVSSVAPPSRLPPALCPPLAARTEPRPPLFFGASGTKQAWKTSRTLRTSRETFPPNSTPLLTPHFGSRLGTHPQNAGIQKFILQIPAIFPICGKSEHCVRQPRPTGPNRPRRTPRRANRRRTRRGRMPVPGAQTNRAT